MHNISVNILQTPYLKHIDSREAKEGKPLGVLARLGQYYCSCENLRYFCAKSPHSANFIRKYRHNTVFKNTTV